MDEAPHKEPTTLVSHADAAGRVIFADFASVKYEGVTRLMGEEGVYCRHAMDPTALKAAVAEEPFDLCLVSLLIGGEDPLPLIAEVKAASRNPDIMVLALSRQTHQMHIQKVIKAGAVDFVVDPFVDEDLARRIVYHLGPKQVLETSTTDDYSLGGPEAPFVELMVHASELLSRTGKGNTHVGVHSILGKVAELLGSSRTSLVVVERESQTGLVVASSDDPKFYDVPIALKKYPEMLHVSHTGRFVMVQDASRNALNANVDGQARAALRGSILIFPVRFQGEVAGVLSIRRPDTVEVPAPEVIRVVQALATALAAHSNVKMMHRRLYRTSAGFAEAAV